MKNSLLVHKHLIIRAEASKPPTDEPFKRSEKIGSSRKSQHCRGQAADFECHGHDNMEVFNWIVDNTEFDQGILEFYTGDPASGWLHFSYNENGNRKQTLRAFRNDAGKTQYEEI